MNIFFLDTSPELAARYHCDKHVVKMITETAQLLTSVYYYTGESDKSPYGLAHKNHPCAKWARTSRENWWWLWWLGFYLYKEYQFRYWGRTHKAGEVILSLEAKPPNIIQRGITTPPLCMPEDCKSDDLIESYRNYYWRYKQHILFYTRREEPFWFKKRNSL